MEPIIRTKKSFLKLTLMCGNGNDVEIHTVIMVIWLCLESGGMREYGGRTYPCPSYGRISKNVKNEPGMFPHLND